MANPTSLVNETIELLKANIPSVITALILNPRQVDKRTLLMTLFLPIFTNFFRYYLERTLKMRFDYEVDIFEQIRARFNSFFRFFPGAIAIGENANALTIDEKNDRLLFSPYGNHFIIQLTQEHLVDFCKEFDFEIKQFKEILNESYEIKIRENEENTTIRGRNYNTVSKLLNIFHNHASGKLRKYKIITSSYQSIDSKMPDITFEHIFLSQKSQLLDRIKSWVEKKSFYEKHLLPYKFAMILYGLPGTGKTATSRALANYLNYNYYEISPDSDCSWLNQVIVNKKKAVILIDEIDRIIDGLNRTTFKGKDRDETELGDKFTTMMMKILDSILLSEVVLVFTTNKDPSTFDEALLRPGRIDFTEYFGFCDSHQFKKIFEKYCEISLREDYVFPEGKYTSAYVINQVVTPFFDEPEKILELLA